MNASFKAYLKSEIIESFLSNKDPIVPTIKANTPHAIIIATVENTFSESVTGLISPYPTVAIVVKDQNAADKYNSKGV